MRPTCPRALGVPHHDVAHLQDLVADRHQVVVGLGGDADHVIELQVLHPAAKIISVAARISSLVMVLFTTRRSRSGSHFRRDGRGALAAGARQVENLRREIVEAQ